MSGPRFSFQYKRKKNVCRVCGKDVYSVTGRSTLCEGANECRTQVDTARARARREAKRAGATT